MKKFLNFLKNLPNILTIRKFVNNRSEFYDDLLSAFKANISFDSFLKQTQGLKIISHSQDLSLSVW